MTRRPRSTLDARGYCTVNGHNERTCRIFVRARIKHRGACDTDIPADARTAAAAASYRVPELCRN